MMERIGGLRHHRRTSQTYWARSGGKDCSRGDFFRRTSAGLPGTDCKA
ncbi:MAG: hypothetical protein VX794_04405 [Nitrospinota bacterium]|nr:hypothetical protein [Nitrospinota bacterium]